MTKRTNSGLLIALAASVLGCVAVGFISFPMLLFATVVPFFCVQLLLLRVTKRWYLRALPAVPILICLGWAGYLWIFGVGWDTLGALILDLIAIAPAVGCVLALVVHRLPGSFLSRMPRARCWAVIALVILGCAGAWMGQVWGLFYWEAALVKVISLGGCFALCLFAVPGRELGAVFARPDKQSLKLSLALSAAVLVFLLGGYALLSPWMDLSAVPEQLRLRDITAETFPAIAVYIILFNSLLEEVFFRGMAFLTLRRYAPAPVAWGFSALTFAVYHVVIMDNWFHPVLMALFIAGLAVAGLFFNWLDRKGSIWPAWLVHAAANVGINLIGCKLLGLF